MKRSLAPAVLLVLLPAACTSPSPARAIAVEPAVEVEVVPLKHSAAAEIEELVLELVDAARQAAKVRQSGGSPRNGVDGTKFAFGPEFRVLADPRTNSLVIAGTPEQRARTKELVARLDVEEPLYDSASR